jgi:CheY-like chemotaxis protein
MGYEVLEAASDEDALKVWEEQHVAVDLVLTDMVVSGGMTGLDLAEKLRERSPSSKDGERRRH